MIILNLFFLTAILVKHYAIKDLIIKNKKKIILIPKVLKK